MLRTIFPHSRRLCALNDRANLRLATGSTSKQVGYMYTVLKNRSGAARPNEVDVKIESKYTKTVLLPNTTFSQRANSAVREPEIQQWWKQHKIYEALCEQNTGATFTLHDGPPYANGELHIGHALNKVLKDFINRYQILRGRKVKFVPGWDTHGLPIELKVLQGLKSVERENLTPIQLRKLAAAFAVETMRKQRIAFERYGIWADWEKPYLTLQPEYEAAQIKVFGQMVAKGHIYRGKRPVHWSPSSRTALAEAELEYPENHISKSIYLGFKVTRPSAALAEAVGPDADVRVAVWTTTPWTIPANLAVAVNPVLEYCTASHPMAAGGAKFLVATALVDALGIRLGLDAALGHRLNVERTFSGSALLGTQYQHPFYSRKSEIIAGGDYITTASGTGLVHTAPGHGAEDYATGLQHGLPLLSPVDDLGRFTEEAGSRFVGLEVLGAGNAEVIKALAESGALIKTEDYAHKYPYDWRTKKPTIFRATEQWFASVSNFRENAVRAIHAVEWIPANGKNRILSMAETRGDWCISRQRSWGVPIPAFYRADTQEAFMTPETIAHIKQIFRQKGSDSWWQLDVHALLPASLQHMAPKLTKGSDTMDVWFDSGTSWAGVLQERASEGLNYPADLYLEGSDQHRGWFQSSLLTSVASQGVAPYKTVLTHGFVLDANGHKMSKSLGNVVDPRKIIEGGSNQKLEPAYGADTLRLWVASVDYSGDVCVGDNILKHTSETYRKLRNTLRYLVGSLHGFEPARDAVPLPQLASIDQYILGRLSKVALEVQRAYEEHQFYKAHHAIMSFATTDLSAFYLDICKDRLYVSHTRDWRRLSCQTVMKRVLEQLSVLMAPLVPHMAEDVWQSLPYKPAQQSVFQQGWPATSAGSSGSSSFFPPHDEELWQRVRTIRHDVNKCIERMRTAKEIGASQECQVFLCAEDPAVKTLLRALQGDAQLLAHAVDTNGCDDLRFVFIASQVTVVGSASELRAHCQEAYILSSEESQSGLVLGVARARGTKCQRCWYYSESVGKDHEHVDVCLRCADVIRVDKHRIA